MDFTTQSIASISATLGKDPGDPSFADYAEHLRLDDKLTEALQVCLQGLNSNPSCHKGRLVLARIYYQQRFIGFALRELYQIADALPERRSIVRLIERLGGTYRSQFPDLKGAPGSDTISSSPAATVGTAKETVAEVEFDLGALEDIDSKEDKS